MNGLQVNVLRAIVPRGIVRLAVASSVLCLPSIAGATDVTVVGLFPNKAVVVINKSSPRTLSVGQKTAEGVVLLSTGTGNATFEVDGKKRTLEIGEHFVSAAPGARQSITLAADTRGHFMTLGSINGGTVRFMVDTGATLIALPAADAERLGIDYLKGTLGHVRTANGVAKVYQVTLDFVTIGDITMNQVDAVIMTSGLDIALLGMSFLNRTEMKRDGPTMTLVKRF